MLPIVSENKVASQGILRSSSSQLHLPSSVVFVISASSEVSNRLQRFGLLFVGLFAGFVVRGLRLSGTS